MEQYAAIVEQSGQIILFTSIFSSILIICISIMLFIFLFKWLNHRKRVYYTYEELLKRYGYDLMNRLSWEAKVNNQTIIEYMEKQGYEVKHRNKK